MKRDPAELATVQGSAIPPYLSFKTFQSFIESLRVAIPSRIDRSVMSSMSGAVQAQLMSALRYLGLVSHNGITTDKLGRLVNSDGAERKKMMHELLMQAYPFLFHDFDLQKATTRQIEEKFMDVGASGETVRKCFAFFVAAAKEAELPLSPHIKPVRQPRRPNQRLPRGPSTPSENVPPILERPPDTYLTWQQLLLSKFPSFDPTWPDEVKTKWFEAFDQLMKQGEK
jgi:hypothetical protein